MGTCKGCLLTFPDNMIVDKYCFNCSKISNNSIKIEETKVEKVTEIVNSKTKGFMSMSFIMIFFLGFQGYFFGANDEISLISICLTSFLLFLTIHKIHVSSREILRINVKTDSWLYKFLTGKSFITIVTALSISLIASIILVTILKGMIINYGQIVVLFIIFIASFIIFSTVELFSIGQNYFKENLKEELALFANKFVVLISLVLIFNLIISIFITILDMDTFINSKVNLNNFIEGIILVDKNGSNFYSRIIINFYLFIDNLKIAVTNYGFTNILEIKKVDYFWTLFFTSLFFNFIKMFGFSFAFIYLQLSITELINKMQTINIKKGEQNENI